MDAREGTSYGCENVVAEWVSVNPPSWIPSTSESAGDSDQRCQLRGDDGGRRRGAVRREVRQGRRGRREVGVPLALGVELGKDVGGAPRSRLRVAAGFLLATRCEARLWSDTWTPLLFGVGGSLLEPLSLT